MAADAWEIGRLNVAGYLGRLGIAGREVGEPLVAGREPHVGQHPGVGLAAVQEKFVGRDEVATAFDPPKPRLATMPGT